jgi:hypothetical protein
MLRVGPLERDDELCADEGRGDGWASELTAGGRPVDPAGGEVILAGG